MRARGVALALAAALLAVVHAHAQRPGSYGATNPPPLPGAPRFVQIESFEGLPRDSAARAIVSGVFRGAFAEFELPVEKPGARAGQWLADGAIPARFRLLEGATADSVWTIQVVLGFPRELPPRKATSARRRGPTFERARPDRVSRGLNVVVAALSPEARFRGARPVPLRVSLALPPDSAGRYDWELAARGAAFVALEALHRSSGDLPEPLRLTLDPVRRVVDAPR